MRSILLATAGLTLFLPLYTYVAYPLLLRIIASLRAPFARPPAPTDWPQISITVPAFNEEATIASLIESLLRIDYPPERRQILVVSDASSDRTDEIVAVYADRGVELLRMEQRVGKTAAENTARSHLTGEIIVNTDASVRIHPQAIKALVSTFEDPTVGVASGRDVSVAAPGLTNNVGEKGYVGYEMWVRSLETRVSSIVQASGCLYAIRRHLHDIHTPDSLTRDFTAVANAHELGYRAVSVDDAVCYVPRAGSLRQEYRRKTRTMTRGLETLFYKRTLLNPLRHGLFAWMVFSHKICRWLVPLAVPVGLLAILALSLTEDWARWLLVGGAAALLFAAIGLLWPPEKKTPRIFAMPAYALAANTAAVHAWMNTVRGRTSPTWNPTRRKAVEAR